MILVIDNYDSFTYNLVQYLLELGARVCVKRHDISLEDIKRLNPSKILLSPGPGSPDESGVCLEVIKHLTHLPIFGVCLGMQAIAQAFGAKIIRANHVMHGKVSMISHQNQGVFKGLPNPCQATRYHSLIVEPNSLSQEFIVTARAVDSGDIMGIKHQSLALEGVQFHPESILTPVGKNLLLNFIEERV